MKRTYHCLKCQSVLNPNVKIVMVVAQGPNRGLALFSPQPGNYSIIYADHLCLRQGELTEFFCPVCGADLTSTASPNLARLGVQLGDGTQGWVDFSRWFGEQATYYVFGDQVRSYGENAQLYSSLNFFGEGLNREE